MNDHNAPTPPPYTDAFPDDPNPIDDLESHNWPFAHWVACLKAGGDKEEIRNQILKQMDHLETLTSVSSEDKETQRNRFRLFASHYGLMEALNDNDNEDEPLAMYDYSSDAIDDRDFGDEDEADFEDEADDETGDVGYEHAHLAPIDQEFLKEALTELFDGAFGDGDLAEAKTFMMKTHAIFDAALNARLNHELAFVEEIVQGYEGILEDNESLCEAVIHLERDRSLTKVSTGLTQMQRERLRDLSENVDYQYGQAETYEARLLDIRNQLFGAPNSQNAALALAEAMTSEAFNEEFAIPENVSDEMSRYMAQTAKICSTNRSYR